jgi:glycosyltransferase involved in cell wall biosynthesis
MRVMEIISGGGVNGAIQHGLLLTRELARRGHSVAVLCEPGGWLRRELACEPVEVVECDFHRWPPDEVRRIAAIARAKRLQVYHTHQTCAHRFGVLLRWVSGIPCVATAHAFKRHWHWILNRRIIAVSQATRTFLITRNFVPPYRIEVIPNFVDHRRFADVGLGSRAHIRAAFGIDEAFPLIGSVGRVFPNKGWPDLLWVLAQVSAAEPAARLLVVGGATPAYRAKLDAQAAVLGVAQKIVWAGERLDIPQVLSAVDIFVSLSRRETFGLSILEAMAAGIPVVATAVGGVPEVVRDGETGLLIPSGDCDAMARAIVSLLRDERRRRHLGQSGQRDARERFAAELHVPRIEATLARVASRRT